MGFVKEKESPPSLSPSPKAMAAGESFGGQGRDSTQHPGIPIFTSKPTRTLKTQPD